MSSQALWQHTSSQLALTSALYALVRGRRQPRWLAFAGFALAMGLICRPPNILIAGPLGVYVFVYHRAQFARFLLSGVPPVLFQLWYNAHVFRAPSRFPGGGATMSMIDPEAWTTPILEGLAGILFSPSRGLFVYSPVFVFGMLGLALAWQRGGDRLLRYSSIGVAMTVLMYSKWFAWWAGYTYGPRFFGDVSPILALALYPVQPLLDGSRILRHVLTVLVVWSVAAHALGAFWDDGQWNVDAAVLGNPAALWWWTDNQLVNAAAKAAKASLHMVLGWLGASASRAG